MSSAKERGELTITLRMTGRPVVLVGEGDVAEEHRALLKRAGAFIVAEGSKAAFAVVVDDPAAVSRLKVRGCLVYAIGQPELSDFALAGPTPQGKAARKADSALAKSRATDPAAEPVAQPALAPAPPPSAAPMQQMPETVEPRRAARRLKVPKPEQPRLDFKMPEVALAPALRVASATGQLAPRLWGRTKALLSPLLRISMPVTQVLGANIQHRIDRARERPISLDLALVKGGLLDHELDASKPTGSEPHGTMNPDRAAPLSDAADPDSS